MVFVVGAHEARRESALVVDDAVGDEKAELAGVEILDRPDIEGRKRDVLQRPVQARPVVIVGIGEPEHDTVAVGIAHRKGARQKRRRYVHGIEPLAGSTRMELAEPLGVTAGEGGIIELPRRALREEHAPLRAVAEPASVREPLRIHVHGAAIEGGEPIRRRALHLEMMKESTGTNRCRRHGVAPLDHSCCALA